MGRAAYAACRCLRADTAPVRSSDRGERDRAAGMSLTIQTVALQRCRRPSRGDRFPSRACRGTGSRLAVGGACRRRGALPPRCRPSSARRRKRGARDGMQHRAIPTQRHGVACRLSALRRPPSPRNWAKGITRHFRGSGCAGQSVGLAAVSGRSPSGYACRTRASRRTSLAQRLTVARSLGSAAPPDYRSVRCHNPSHL